MYLNQKSVKKAINDAGFQVTKDGIVAIDKKIDEFIYRLTNKFNGHHKRIDATIVNLTNL
jgi:hypothetical protein